MLDANFSGFHSAYIQHLDYSTVQARSNSVVGFSETSEQTYL